MVMLSKLGEALFVETLRRYMEQLPAEQTGWLAGARDPVVGAVLALLHRRPSHSWTAAELAARAVRGAGIHDGLGWNVGKHEARAKIGND